MQSSIAAIELSAAHWEQWIGATLRAGHFRALLATARPPRRRPVRAPSRPRTRGSLVWMLAVSVAGFCLLR